MTTRKWFRTIAVTSFLASLAFASPIDLGHPTLAPTVGNAIGNNERNLVFDALVDFTIFSAGIKFDPLAGGATQISLQIWSVLKDGANNGTGTRNALLASSSGAVTDVGMTFYDVPLTFTFLAGNRYAVGFSSLAAGGWGNTINNMEFYKYDPTLPGYAPYTVAGALTVLDGGADGDFKNDNMPHVRVDSNIPEPGAWVLLGTGLALLSLRSRLWRR
jgi:hypothetical protein